MFLWDDKEMVFAHWTLGQGDVEVFRLTPEYEIFIDSWVFEAEPAVFVFLDFDTFHLEVDLQRPTLQSEFLILVHEVFCDLDVCKANEAVWLLLFLFPLRTASIVLFAVEVLEVAYFTMLL